MANDYTRIEQPAGTGNPHTIENPTQSQPWGSNNYEVPNTNQRTGLTPADGGSPDLGDLGRKYNFGNTYTNLSFARDPFVHLLTKFKKKPTDDFKFEYAIKRPTATFKRYGYVIGVEDAAAAITADNFPYTGGAGVADTSVGIVPATAGNTAWNNATYADAIDQAASEEVIPQDALDGATDTFCNLWVMGDYKTAGNITNKVGVATDSSQHIMLGAPLTQPNWFLKNQVVRVPIQANGSGKVDDYVMLRVLDTKTFKVYGGGQATDAVATAGDEIAEGVILYCKYVKATSVTTPTSLAMSATTIFDVSHGSTEASKIATKLEPARMYIAGTAYHELSGYGDTWKSQPFTTDYGQTQIFKKTAMMSGRAMATSLKFGENPWANEWKDKMTEMTWEVGQAGYFGEQFTDNDGITYTEGIVNFILNNGNQLTWTDAMTVDDYMEQLSALHDPRYTVGGKVNTVYYCNTQVWNWHAKLGGFMKNNAEISANYNVQFSGTGKMAGVKYRSFDVDGTTIKLVRDIHLDGTNVKMIAANMSACAIRPLIGNGVNRDVTVYPGVKTVKNSGEDYRVDLIQGDIGFEFSAPETHAVWLQG